MAASEPHAATPAWILALAVIALTVAVFGQVVTHQFINYDDGQFVFENAHVREGLTAGSIRWALTSAEIGYYPLTWLSHMTDVALFGMAAGGHLAMSLLLHVASSCILFFALTRMTGAPLRSAFVAALFAIHPMHVESVAWVSERKDTLSTLFGLLALLFYAMPRSIRRDVAVALALAASLLAKQMLVTLPFVLLLLDYWPLRRPLKILEKLPLFAIAAAGVGVAIVGQQNLNAVQSTAVLPLADRIANALVAYAAYIGKLLWPSHLAPMYPLSPANFTSAAFALVLLAAITLAAWSLRKHAPWFIVGWLWFAGTLIPVIGIVQIGAAGMADRYTYFPSIGLFIAIVWGVADLVPHRAAALAGALALVILAAAAFIQTSHWSNTDTLFTHTLEVTGPNPIAEYTLGQSLQTSDPDRAVEHLRRAIELTEAALRNSPEAPRPEIYAQSHVAIGTALLTKVNTSSDAAEKSRLAGQAAAEYEAALRIDPTAGNARRNLALAQSMRNASAREVETNIDRFIDAGIALSQQKRFEDAVAEYRKAVALAPSSMKARVYHGIGLAQAGHNAEAAHELREAQRIDAARANRFVTGILRLQQSPQNLNALLQQLER